MRDTLPHYPYILECDIVNLNTSDQSGSHWVCYYWNKNDRTYNSCGNSTVSGKEVIQRNTDIKQVVNMSVCGHFFLFMLKSLTNGEKFQTILNQLYMMLW